ncbi:15272_t:CDS:2 [Funneliformis caledonium]|uniref:15272_t:CDS:1 n=2 Tax=Funneliformis TaxID=1117308 RepID=A0A9N9GBB9_9GLOM|nr:15272_t:CDS:2 [Funneliformis caledonium]CAG8680752.1 8016_t:CDS:2 [Funneliformis mosseae]
MSSKAVSQKPTSSIITYAVLAAAAVGFLAVFVYRRIYPQSRRGTRDEDNETPSHPETRRVTRTERDQRNLASRLFRNTLLPPKKKTISISMKNTLLWNPSTDPDSPNHAFYESIVPFLHQLSKIYVIHLVCPVSSTQEKEQILGLLRSAKLFSSKVIDERRVLFCESDEGKIHIIRHLEASVHVEGGVNGEEAVEMVRGFVGSVLWAIRGGNSEPVNRSEANEVKANVDRSQWSNVEISGNLWTSNLTFEVRGR